jgi:serine/threonine protein kinase
MGWQRFQAEAKSIAKLDHINLVKVSDLGIHEGCLPFYAMEFIDGTTLAEMLEQHGPMPLTQALQVFIQICAGVDYAHRNGIVHRDLKPANIMLMQSAGEKLQVKILDFGLVKLTLSDQQKQSHPHWRALQDEMHSLKQLKLYWRSCSEKIR